MIDRIVKIHSQSTPSYVQLPSNMVRQKQQDSGIPGTNGAPGNDGAPGLPGIDGTPGTNGEPGPPGNDGTPGTPGIDGTNGTDGTPGTNGDPGLPGPKDSILNNAGGIYAVACIEGDRPYLMTIVPKGRPLHFKMECAMREVFRFRSHDNEHDLVLGVRADLADWCMPDKSLDQFNKNQMWLAKTFGS